MKTVYNYGRFFSAQILWHTFFSDFLFCAHFAYILLLSKIYFSFFVVPPNNQSTIKLTQRAFYIKVKKKKKCCHPLSHRTLSTVINLSCQIFRLIFMLQFNSQLRAILSIHQQCVIRVFVANRMRKILDVIWWRAPYKSRNELYFSCTSARSTNSQ